MSSESDNLNRDQGGNSIFSGISPARISGVKNIEAAYSRAGASNHHTPGSASKLRPQDQQGAVEEQQGVGSEKFADNISDGRYEPTVVGKLFNNMISGTSNTK
ncbi:hypothetical protein G7Y89_g4376 [Cudoniella acicularis]|uniref:Uncharacterized protein n=1 Tax=Cudoniella acicularis TaxID=354080 RepID=A0A8H4RQV4_9HELO|nr:hypothetical protein G7Y89_g4376 [Cudoniella acicularis]